MALKTDSLAVLAISLLEAVAGMLSSSFIVFDILRNFSKGQVISTRDKILMALSVSNLAYPIMLFTSIVCDVFSLPLNAYTDVLLYTLTLYCMSSCSWLMACLCFFYYIKVAHLRSRYLSRLKDHIDVLIPWMIVVVEVISLGGNFMELLLETVTSTNTTDDELSPGGFYDVMYLGNFVSYPLMIVTFTCIMASVMMHIHRMRRNLSTAGTINLEAHQGVVRTMQYLVAFYIVFFLLLVADYLINLPGVWRDCTYKIILLTFSPVQSVILIHGNPRLRESWKQMWGCGGPTDPLRV
ncbi:taste receptor type 2 member 39-like [Dendropsophus ebraccatus]|uniref:taste receptor type 2 member 39-like n=1 Tax=Dendropsophus ebraccatus TaxID=150705 RepID=UPI0038314F3A